MRYDELSLRIPGHELRMRFHPRVTVLGGLAAHERRGMAESLVGALADGPDDGSILSYHDTQGRRVSVARAADGTVTHSYDDDGTIATDLVASLGLDRARLLGLVHLLPADVGLLPSDISIVEPPDLAEARAALTQLTEELEGALAARQAVEAMREELAQLDERLREADEGRAKRRYARLLGELENVRAEAAVIRSGETGAADDRRFLAAGAELQDVVSRWRKASTQLRDARARFGGRTRLDPRSLEQAEELPDEVPAEVDTLARTLEDAEARRDSLAAQLAERATSGMPQPSDPAVARLATLDQEALWSAADAVLETGLRLERESLALGGLEAEGLVPALVQELEDAHTAVGVAEEEQKTRRILGVSAGTVALAIAVAVLVLIPLAAPAGLLVAVGAAFWGVALPQRKVLDARGREEDVLIRAGVPTWLSFHMRRVDATIDPRMREALQVNALELRVARARWQDLAGDIDPADALMLEDEIRGHAEAIARTEGAAYELDALRRELHDVAVPAVERALAALMDACAPFGVDEAALAPAFVRHQVGLATTARLQRALEDAEAEETQLRAEVSARLGALGFDGDRLAESIAALTEALSVAAQREDARSRVRSADEVDADLARLEERARREHRREWGSDVSARDGEEPDVQTLQRKRESTAVALEAAGSLLPDVEHLKDRRGALSRRVAVLQREHADTADPTLMVQTSDVEHLLTARIIEARNAGRRGESLPVLLDDPFVALQGERKWEVLDLVERLSQKVQVVYLTDDPDVVLWARRRVNAGSVALLECSAAETEVEVRA